MFFIFSPNHRDDEITECFYIYVAISQIYKAHPDRLRDWLNHPKANGYQALHVTLMSKQGRWIEVQIRSDKMDEIAEQGFAAHWKYKEGGEIEFTEDEGELNEWLHTIKEILDDPQPDAMDFLDAIKLNLFASEIFVFTPKGEIKTMPAGCTALDFAFSIHTFLGSHCIGAKVNHKLVPLSHKLQSGDQIEILTSKSQHVQPSWINFVSTAKAKAKIQAILRRDGREIQKRGEEELRTFFKSNDIEYTASAADQLATFHDIAKREDFFQAIGEKRVILGEREIDILSGKKKEHTGGRWRRFVPFLMNNTKVKQNENEEKQTLLVVTDKLNRKKPIFITDDNITQYKFMHCCHPIPGDDALGFIDEDENKLFIHKRNCEKAMKLKSNFGNNIIAINWDIHTPLFETTINISGIDEKGMLLKIAESLYQQENVNVVALNIAGNNGIFEAQLTVRVHNTEEVRNICLALKKIDKVMKAVRFD